MFTNQKVLGALLLLFIIGGASYFTYTKFRQEVSSITASLSPSPASLEFVLGNNPPSGEQSPIPAPQQQPQQQYQNPAQVSQLPLLKNKRLVGFPGVLKPEVLQNKKAVITTTKGNIEIEIFPDSPMGASNFIILAANGFYHGLTFHRVEAGFVVQGGDPLGNGTGGPGYIFPDERVTREYKKGTVAYANSGPNTNGSQFFIVLQDNPPLQPVYTIFGQVISGMDVVQNLVVGDVMQTVTIQNLK